MYPIEKKKEAIKLWLKYDKSISAVVKELPWLKRSTLGLWINEYNARKKFKNKYTRKPKYSKAQRRKAVNYFINHGKSFTNTVNKLGYPCRYQLQKWVMENYPEYKPKVLKSCSAKVTKNLKKKAVIKLCSSNKAAKDIAEDVGVERVTLYNWKKDILGKGNQHSMAKKKKEKELTKEELLSENDRLKKKLAEIEDKIYKKQLEYDILEKAAELIKKETGINPSEQLTNNEKAIVIDALRNKYKLYELLNALCISKSSYNYAKNAVNKENKYADVIESIKEIFNNSRKTYGYRRIRIELKKKGIILSEKVIRRLMKQEELIVYVPRTKYHYSSYEGEITPAVENIVDRDFHSDKPFEKILTDLSEFHIPAGRVYLSPAIDCFDGLPISWTIGTSPNAELANTMLDQVISVTPDDCHPIIHSDRGCHYRWPGWIERMDNAGFIRSMSKKGCSPDNSACEGFFGRLKNEFFYCRDWNGITIEEFIEELNDYIYWYGHSRIKISLGGLSPIEYRQSLGLM